MIEQNNYSVLAKTIGVLFIIGTVAGILSVVLTGSILDSTDYLYQISQNEGKFIVGILAIVVMAVALSLIPVLLFPIFRKYNEALALGAVVFRGALEAAVYLAIVINMLLLVTLSRQLGSGMEFTELSALGALLQGAGGWLTHILSIVFSIGALMIYWLFYISRLIPRWLAIWGLLGGVTYLMSPILSIAGVEGVGFLMAPLAVQEMVLAIWLLIKGFDKQEIRRNPS